MNGIEVFAWVLTAILGVVFIISLVKIAKNPRRKSSAIQTKEKEEKLNH
ncbi:hypothetical protein [Bacillus salipaludis]|uniref:Uncharacterized protein n=1 Tax=Bacillus salipaludis TaxID=2547811 RepID=A0AA90R8J3_9BACI|nr:hypothetical protein [Bacillus salipaludis]MDQ6598398.1 hypothetical protein [Bacillus salipaludis]